MDLTTENAENGENLAHQPGFGGGVMPRVPATEICERPLRIHKWAAREEFVNYHLSIINCHFFNRVEG